MDLVFNKSLVMIITCIFMEGSCLTTIGNTRYALIKFCCYYNLGPHACLNVTVIYSVNRRDIFMDSLLFLI